MFKAMRWLLATIALLAGLAGVTVHLTVDDADSMFAPVFYALPLPVSGGLLLGAAILSRRRLSRRLIGLSAALVLGVWFFKSYGWDYPVGGKWKVITWNMARPRHPFPPLIALVKAERPDVIVLVESGDIAPSQVLAYERSLPGYRMFAGSKGLACLVRGQILEASVTGLVNGSDEAHIRARLGGEELNVFVVDLTASPFLPRQPQLDLLAERTRGHSRTVVMGDFNTPLESVYLAVMREHFSEVMEGPHRGFRETWFFGLPLLSLDHVWLSRDLEPRFATRQLTFDSDHAPVIATFSVRK
jgi:endonuclease/exonuclease/phosphatase (EEP) superfamily protein YafD